MDHLHGHAHNPMGNLGSQSLNFSIFNAFKTDNIIIDTILLTVVGAIIAKNVEKLVTYLSSMSPESIYYFFFRYIQRIYSHFSNKAKQIERIVNINYITDDKKVNELYDAVFWYITNSEIVNFEQEPNIKFTYDKKLEPTTKIDEDNIKINKVVSKYKEKKLSYKGFDIFYMLSTEVITIYADEERKKENRVITLRTLVDENDRTDILDDFGINCICKYVEFLKKKNWEPQIFHNEKNQWTGKPLKTKRRIESIVLPNKKDIVKDLDFFLKGKEWYNDIGIPYTRGYLFYGKPGCGKTSLIKAISNYSKRNIHYLILNDVTSDVELFNLLSKIDYASTILVIEDIDCASEIIKKRKSTNISENDNAMELAKIKEELELLKSSKFNNQQRDQFNPNQQETRKGNGITLSGLLNAIDGINEAEGRILIMTTNKPETLDDALIRPGRVDKRFRFDYASRNQIAEMYMLFFNKQADLNDLATIEDGKYSPAQISSLFMQYVDNPEQSLKNINMILAQEIIKIDDTSDEKTDEKNNETNDKPNTNDFVDVNVSGRNKCKINQQYLV